MGIHAKSLDNLARQLGVQAHHRTANQEAEDQLQRQRHAELLRELKTLTEPPAATSGAPPSTAFQMDSTLGTRTRPAQKADRHKSESDLRFYSGFASRGDITGDG